MRQKLLITLVAFAASLTTPLRAGNVVTLQEDRGYAHTDPDRYEIPQVTYDDDIVAIRSETLIADMRVIIEDILGNVIYDKRITVNPSGNIIYIPEEYSNEKYSIKLVYENKRMFGFFER